MNVVFSILTGLVMGFLVAGVTAHTLGMWTGYRRRTEPVTGSTVTFVLIDAVTSVGVWGLYVLIMTDVVGVPAGLVISCGYLAGLLWLVRDLRRMVLEHTPRLADPDPTWADLPYRVFRNGYNMGLCV